VGGVTYPVMIWLCWAFLAVLCIILCREVWDIWRSRPTVVFDPRYRCWRSARQVRKERFGR